MNLSNTMNQRIPSLSFLDHHLVCGNSLVRIGTIDEARELIGGTSGDLFSTTAENLLGRSKEALERLGRLSDANSREIRQARDLRGGPFVAEGFGEKRVQALLCGRLFFGWL